MEEIDPKLPAPRFGFRLELAEERSVTIPLCDMTLGESLGAGADAASALLLPLAVALVLEEGTLAKPVSLAVVLAVGPGAVVAGVWVGVLLDAPGLDVDGPGAGAELVVGEGRGTTELLPGVVPGEDGGTGTSLCMHTSVADVK